MNRKNESPQKASAISHIYRTFAVAVGIYFVYYLWWRASSTLNPHALFFSWLLWAAEAFGVLSYLLFAWMTQNILPKKPFKNAPPGLAVDVFIPTYNEDPQILEATLTGCKKIKYPHTTYLLDDGRRDEVRRLAQRLGTHYITRPTNEHAKAGNINHALPLTRGEFIVILDADMVPQPNFLHRTLGYFSNPRLAFIQLPQEFYNQDSIQHDRHRPEWHEQALFYRVIQPGKNYTNSAFWCGSPSVVRRSALVDVGGVATETVTEDIHTSVRMHSRSWDSLYLNEPLAYGIAPQTIHAFLQQRLRWAQGTMQLYRSKDSPLWKKGLTWKQRISYFSSFLAYFESFQKLILILIPCRSAWLPSSCTGCRSSPWASWPTG
jgi:cellulose synthase (UDP-forming)